MEHITNAEIKTWLLAILKKEKIKDLSVEILGNTEKGEGYSGDIIFVRVSAITDDNLPKKYDLVLKCSKRSQAFREKIPAKEAFYNEIFVYDTLLPYFTQFQLEKGIKTPFNSVPKCYGTFVSDNTEILVFENLKKSGYDVWPKKNPATRNHLNLVLGEYARFHAISVALKDQRPETSLDFENVLVDIMQKFYDSTDPVSLYSRCIDEIAEMLKDEVEETVLLKWKDFKKQICYILRDLIKGVEGIKAIVHGDCWNNNFMYKNESDSINTPISVAIIDWQGSRYTSPVIDIAYHLFCCISGEDLNNLSAILQYYHRIFSEQVELLGSNAEVLYPFKQFLEDWKKYSKFGILLSCLVIKVCSSEKDEVADLAESVEDGKDFTDFFTYEIKDNTNFKRRMRPIVEHVVRNNLI